MCYSNNESLVDKNLVTGQVPASSLVEAHFLKGHWDANNSIPSARLFVTCSERCHLFSFPHT